MARPQKRGLEYFPHDINMTHDEKVEFLESIHGIIGYGVYNKLLERIYQNGYFSEWGERAATLMAPKIKIHDGTVMEKDALMAIVQTCLTEKLFDQKMFTEYSILTSASIQNRYLEITKKRADGGIDPRYRVLEELTPVSDAETPVNSEFSTQRKVKESKEKERKEWEVIPPSRETVHGYFKAQNLILSEASKFFSYYESNGWRVGKNKMKNWHSAASGWNMRAKEYGHAPAQSVPPKPTASPTISVICSCGRQHDEMYSRAELEKNRGKVLDPCKNPECRYQIRVDAILEKAGMLWKADFSREDSS